MRTTTRKMRGMARGSGTINKPPIMYLCKLDNESSSNVAKEIKDIDHCLGRKERHEKKKKELLVKKSDESASQLR